MTPSLHARTRVRGSDLGLEPFSGSWSATTCGTSWASTCTYGELTSGVPEGFLYEGQLRPVAWLTGSGQAYARFVYALHANVPEYMVTAEGTFRFVTDHLGSPRLVVNASTGAVVQRIDYDEWGVVLADSNPGFQPFGFAGGLYDRDTGLVRFGARDYDPSVGRWTTKDPLGLEGGLNVYEYSGNDPVNLTDPSGLTWVYHQNSGQLWYEPNNGDPAYYWDSGYSGVAPYQNHAFQSLEGAGPLPEGDYTISPIGTVVTGSGTTLLNAMRLVPYSTNTMFGRGGFIIHGGNINPIQPVFNYSSEGCMVFSQDTRLEIGSSGDNHLRVEP